MATLLASLPCVIAVRGRVGDCVFKTYGQRIIITRVPRFDGYRPSSAQRRQRERMRAATAYAQAVYRDVAAKALYVAAARALRRQPFRLAISDFLSANDPEATNRRACALRVLAADAPRSVTAPHVCVRNDDADSQPKTLRRSWQSAPSSVSGQRERRADTFGTGRSAREGLDLAQTRASATDVYLEQLGAEAKAWLTRISQLERPLRRFCQGQNFSTAASAYRLRFSRWVCLSQTDSGSRLAGPRVKRRRLAEASSARFRHWRNPSVVTAAPARERWADG